MGLLLETDDGLTVDWAVVKRVCGRFDKRREWVDKGTMGAGSVSARTLEVPLPAQREETRDRTDFDQHGQGLMLGTDANGAARSAMSETEGGDGHPQTIE